MERLKVSGSTRAAIWLIRFRDYVLLTTNYHLVLSWTCYSNSQFRILSIRHRWKPLWFRTKFSISPGKLATQQFWNSKSNKELWIKNLKQEKLAFTIFITLIHLLLHSWRALEWPSMQKTYSSQLQSTNQFFNQFEEFLFLSISQFSIKEIHTCMKSNIKISRKEAASLSTKITI